MPRMKKNSVCTRKAMPVVTDMMIVTVDNLAGAEQPEYEDVLSKEIVEKKKMGAKNVMSADSKDGLIEWIWETTLLVPEGFERLQRYSEEI